MYRKLLSAAVALALAASAASAQVPPEQPVAVLQPPQIVQPPPPPVAPLVLPACPTGFARETFLTLPAARHFANAMSRQGYQVRLANHGLRWRVYYGPVPR